MILLEIAPLPELTIDSGQLVFPKNKLAEVIKDVRVVEAQFKEDKDENGKRESFETLFIKILNTVDVDRNPGAFDLIQKAIKLAVAVHANQERKFSKISVLSHIISVAYMVSEVTSDVDTIVAAILHDVLEDAKPPITPDDLRKMGFSENVISKVIELTEQKKEGDDEIEDKREKWWLRKNRSVSHLRIMRFLTTIVKLADAIHFLRDLAKDCKNVNVEDATGFFKVDNASVMGRYQAMIQIVEARWTNHPMLPDMKFALKDMMELLELEEEDLDVPVEKFINHKEADVETRLRRVQLLDGVRSSFVMGQQVLLS